MSEAAAPSQAAQFCADEVRAHDFPAYATTLFLQWWADMLAGTGHGGVEGHPVAAELKRAIAAFQLPIDQLQRLIDGRRHDLYDEPVESLASLEAYLAQTTSVVVGLAARVCDSRIVIPDEFAHRAGLAQGLVEVIALLPHHAARGQMLLPQDLLMLNTVTVADVFAGRVSPGLQALIAFLAVEAEAHLAKARTVAQSLPPSLRPALLPLALTADALMRLRRVDCDPFRLLPASRLAVLWTVWRAARRRRGI
jgi:15-cis-phytoene synthase